MTNENDIKLKAEDAMKANANIDFVRKWCVLSAKAIEETKKK